jgi:hypothetical protein
MSRESDQISCPNKFYTNLYTNRLMPSRKTVYSLGFIYDDEIVAMTCEYFRLILNAEFLYRFSSVLIINIM